MASEKPNEDQEMAEALADLKRLAQTWHQKLDDPLVKQQIEAGTLIVSPLVKELLAMFPRTSKPSTGG